MAHFNDTPPEIFQVSLNKVGVHRLYEESLVIKNFTLLLIAISRVAMS